MAVKNPPINLLSFSVHQMCGKRNRPSHHLPRHKKLDCLSPWGDLQSNISGHTSLRLGITTLTTQTKPDIIALMDKYEVGKLLDSRQLFVLYERRQERGPDCLRPNNLKYEKQRQAVPSSIRACDGIGRHARFRFSCGNACGFESLQAHQLALTKKMQAKIPHFGAGFLR